MTPSDPLALLLGRFTITFSMSSIVNADVHGGDSVIVMSKSSFHGGDSSERVDGSNWHFF